MEDLQLQNAAEFELLLRKYHKAQGSGKAFAKELSQVSHLSQPTISRVLKNPKMIRSGDLQAVCKAWSIGLEDTGRLLRCCE